MKDAYLSEIITRLLPLYGDERKDLPDAVMSNAPNEDRVVSALKLLLNVLLPGHSHASAERCDDIPRYFGECLAETAELLIPELTRALPFRWMGEAAVQAGEKSGHEAEPETIFAQFAERLPAVRSMLIEDIRAAYNGDPAALSYAEVKLTYPSIMAVAVHRIAHELYRLDVPIIPRIMSEWIHSRAGIDIHPGATIGKGFFIDHGTGVVIGETAHIGDHVKLYQGVTLGAKSFPLDENGFPIKHVQRHPTVEDEVIIYANATILGGDTVIGAGSVIGGNVFLMKSVPPGTQVTGKPAELSVQPKKQEI